MHKPDWDGMLEQAAAEVLEAMFFTGVYGPGAPASDGESRLATRVCFEGTPRGCLWLTISDVSAQTLASNFLADAPEPLSPGQLGSVVCELANMICGSLLSQVESQSSFRLSTPELVAASEIPASAPRKRLDLGNGTLNLWLEVDHHAN